MEFDKVATIFDIDKNLLEKIDEFKNERILKHTNDEGKYNIIFHSIPLDAFSKFPMALEEFRIEFGKHPLFQRSYAYNFEGLYHDYEEEFVQVFRNGIFEAVFSDYGSKKRISLRYYNDKFDTFVKESLKIYDTLGINCPILFHVTIINIKDYKLDAGLGVRSHVWDTQRNILNPIGIIIKNDNELDNNINNLFVPIWNHFGISMDYTNCHKE